MNAAAIASALGKARREGREWRCLCPAHDDSNPSLSITEKDGKLLVICRAGCDQNVVIEALTQRGLWSSENGHGHQYANGHDQSPDKQHIVKTYDYLDERGDLLFQVARMGPKKTFFQRAPNGKSDWKRTPDGKLTMEGVRRVPYRLPELIAAARKGNGQAVRVYITEGEKDADRLKAKWGLLATTNPGGCGKWHSGYNRYFSGFDVIVIQDNDDAGRAHAQTVAANLRPIAASVRILELRDLPPKGDISDWLDRNPDAMQSDFEALIEHAESLKPPNAKIEVHDAGDIDVSKIPPRGWLLGVTFCRKFISGLIAEGGAGKTAVRYAQYLASASGRKLTDEHVHHRARALRMMSTKCAVDSPPPYCITRSHQTIFGGGSLTALHKGSNC